ncbi:MAG: response regulator [Proteobacteria bacterium]|nr:MAG: response regulator [Pseudomonadota bacterium]
MQPAPLIEDDILRVEAVEAFHILDTLPEQVYNDLAFLAAELCKVPVALLGLIDRQRQWFKAKIGSELSEIPRDLSFCSHTIAGTSSHIIPDLLQDSRFFDHPLVTGGPCARFYAGVPLITEEGYGVGAICVLDTVPRVMEPKQVQALETIARQIMTHFNARNLLETERRLSNQLSKSKKQLDDFFDLANDFLGICRSDGTFIKISNTFLAVLGYSEEEFLSASFFDLLHPDDKTQTLNGFNNLKREGKSALGNRLRGKNGSYVHLSWNFSSSIDDLVYAVARDMTNQFYLEQSLIQAKEKAETAAATKARFLANMSHEIRTPMNGIIGMTALLMGSTDDSNQLERLGIIQSSGDALLELIDDILDFSKLEVDKIEIELRSFSLADTVKEVIALLETKVMQKKIAVRYDQGLSVPPWIIGDVTRFRQILTNLLSNALKFTEHGTIHITSGAFTHADGQWAIELSVQDTGIGISQKNIDKLFTAFTQEDSSTTRRYGGSGLGLAICKGLCEKMGGSIRVESEAGKGSNFIFNFLAEKSVPSDEQKQKDPLAKISPDLAKNKPLRILVAEDNRTNQLVITGILGRAGYTAVLASDGSEVLKALEKETFDLILMDCHMPIMDGFEASSTIIKKFEGKVRPYIIALSASTQKADIERCFECGMDHFLSKPVTVKSLFEALDKLSSKI